MNLNVNINTDDYCHLIILDDTEYLDDCLNTINPLQFKFGDTASVISIIHQDIREDKLSYFQIFKHINKRLFQIPISFDGVFEVTYTVIPTYEWYSRILKSLNKETILNLFNGNLIVLNKDKLVHIHNSGEDYLSVDDFLKLKDLNSNSISNKTNNLFSICKLRKCYVNLCYLIFESRAFSSCWNKNQIDSELIFKRDLVWMAINVILYLYKKGDISEATRILSLLNGCNGICKSSATNNNNENEGCGCR